MSKVTMGNDDAVAVLKRLLDVNAARQKVAARNLANSGTEGYEPKTIEFSGELDRALGKVEMERTSPHHLDSARARERTEGFLEVVDKDGAVDDESRLEQGVAELADAEIAYATAARLMSKRIETVKTAITGRP